MTKLFKRYLIAEYLRYAFARPASLLWVTLFNLALLFCCGFIVLGKYYSAIVVVIVYCMLVAVYALVQWSMFKRYKNFSK